MSQQANAAGQPARRDLANAIRALSMDAVQAANSGHPGAPMGMADIAEVLWNDYLKHNPANPRWPNRDRFVLSNGHGSMLLYSLLHLTGYDVSIDELRNFRQFGQRTAGHPEYEPEMGVETTTGPLGQGVTNAVGMALAEKMLAAQFNRDGFPVVDHRTWVFVGDGCLMEGVSHEACSLAGTLQLGKLIAFYDDNDISIDGNVSGWFTDDTPARFEAYGWQVIRGVEGHDPVEIQQAIETARAETGRPTLICARTVIGFGSPNKQGTEATHGAPLGEDEIVEMDRMRKLIADHMVRSVQTSPHVTSFVEADVTRIVDWRNRNKSAFQAQTGQKLTFTPFFIEAVAKALREFPGVNASVDGDCIILKKGIHIGMAAATPEGNLIVPVIRNADRYNLNGLATIVNDLAARARQGALKPDEISGGTYTVSNVGTFGNVFGTPIINQPQVGILALGAIRKKPAVVESEEGDMIAVRHMMFLSHSYDHRVVDGQLGGSFVRRVADHLESFDPNRPVV